VQVYAGRRHGKYISGRYTVALEPAADKRLSIKPAGIRSTVARIFGERDVEVGDATFDSAFDVQADEPARARVFLNQRLCAMLLSWKETHLHITDETVVLGTGLTPYVWYSVEELARRAPPVQALAQAVEASLLAVPPSMILAPHFEPWQRCAEAHRLTFSPSPLRV
jgi:hypothetical protein